MPDRRRPTPLFACMVVAALVLPAVTACGTGSAHPEPTVESALSQSPLADALYRCITDRGWTVTLTSDGGIDASSDTIPKEQYDRYLADTWACNSEVSARFPVDDRQKHLLYGAELAKRDCLEAHGYAVDEAPSLQTFLDGYESRAWSAMASSDVARLSQTMAESEWEAINRSCPQPVPGALK